ncbi:GRAM domain-containing protein / ABA-responsive protein-like protein [Rhynchospora pubera]|uniref:GRAM domain-containing protein / ABA-responsive protein-like protein n=1 Tax=Rhynchospora pubera TaxID=906938 RepID=A0AAV8DHI1_9POAL|nr:GRAM domain-containing protein / ABA-responsive protein-like protein [Rhynchospora pubera]
MDSKDSTKKEEAQSTETQKWGTKLMGPPAAPTAHPQNQEAAQWQARESDEELPPYVLREPLQQQYKPNTSPMEHILDYFNTWTKRAEELASNIWHNLKMAPSAPEAAMGKLSLTAKALSGGGFESLYKQTFHSDPAERLKKTFACYLSTATGPVAGTLYLTNLNVAFCSDRPLSFTAPSGQVAWSYYKVMVPLGKIAHVNPITMKENPPEKYIQIATVDGHEFWFMGFVSYDKAVKNLCDSVSEFNSTAHHVA